MMEDDTIIEMTTHSNSKLCTSFQHDNSNFHGIGSIRISHDVATRVIEEINEDERAAQAGDSGRRSLYGSERRSLYGSISLSRDVAARVIEEIDEDERVAQIGDSGRRSLYGSERRSLYGSERHEINGNTIDVGLRGMEVIPGDDLICSYPRGDPTWIATSPVSPFSSDIIASPMSDNLLLVSEGRYMDKTQHHQHPPKQGNQEKYSCIMEYIMIFSHLGVFGIVGIFVRYSLQILFGPNVADVTNYHSALYVDLPSNMVGSFFMGWVGVAFKRDISLFSEALAIGLSTGLMGSITTFTSWIQEIVNLTTKGNWVIGLVGLLLGMELAQMSLALGIESAKIVAYTRNQIKKQQLGLTCIPSSVYYHYHLYGFIMFMFIFGILWVGSLLLSLFNFISHHEKKLWIACVVGPFGVWIRWFMARLNGKGIGAQKHFKWLPIGTLLTNLIASIIMASLSIVHLMVKDHTKKIVIEGLQLGFLGCMSTVSTFVVEVQAMHQSNHSWRAYIYILVSILPAFIFGTLIYSIPVWIRGYS
ncbi:uncharacterized protein LOC131034124 isoform X2 [Cryptomeria japonica]|uniref:uncharacterized protein LOC131034124 isoform X2 n=1 Tax=Cryptomeria japonica TaxID=3369 RepID=UPI0025ACB633|nr:uncharacterized protein LOC131034124 isoform X2 [Cryptomeria japonica]